MSDDGKENQKMVARIKRIRGQVDSVERGLGTGENCAEVLMLLAAIRGGVSSLMAAVLEEHMRSHLLAGKQGSLSNRKLVEEMTALVRAYLK